MAATALGTSCLARVFSALLPPNNDQDEDFYQVMGVPPNASQEDIRKAYKKKSLELHPDKIAQRGGDPETAAKEYEKVQEAHGVLANPKKRRLYHALGCNATQYKFIASGAHHNPTALYENLGQASCAAKSRIVILVACLLCLVLLQPILIVVKINHDLKNEGALENTPWTVILIPWWIIHGCYVGLWVLILCMASEHKCDVFLQLAEQVCWLAWEVLLAVRWDNTVDWNYVDIFVPFYIVILLRIYQPLAAMQRIRKDCKKMISIQYLEEHVIEGRNYQDLSEEEQTQLHKEYILVHNSDDAADDVFEDDEDLEEARVHSSPEFHHAMDVYYTSFSKLVNTILFAPPFCVLCVLRLDDHIDVSWWVVFIPIWVHLGWRFLSNTWICCCASVAGEEIILSGMEMPSQTEDNDHQNKDEKENQNTDSALFESSTAFAPTEGSMRNFDKDESDKEKGTDPPGRKAESTKPSSSKTKSKNSNKSAKGNKMKDVVELYRRDVPNDDAKEEGKDEEEKIHIDAETFEEWQSAYQEAEASAMEAQSKAMGDCFLVSLELMILCLLVGKLDQAYETMPGDDVGYNAVWIIFPILLLAGLALCCCACLIYGAGRVEAPEGLMNHQGNETPATPAAAENDQFKSGEKESAATAAPTEEPPKVDEETGGGYDADDID